MLDWHKVCCCFVFYETYKIQSGQCGNFTYEHWYQCSIFMFQTEFSQLLYMYRYSIKKRVLWSNKFGKCYSRMICFLSLLSQQEGSWWDNGHKATKQEMFSEVGLLTGGEVMRSVDCLYLAQSWFGVHGWWGAEGFVTRWILKKHAWEIVTEHSFHGLNLLSACHHSALRISLPEGGKVGSIQLKIISLILFSKYLYSIYLVLF